MFNSRGEHATIWGHTQEKRRWLIDVTTVNTGLAIYDDVALVLRELRLQTLLFLV